MLAELIEIQHGMRFYTDTVELALDYGCLAGVDFRVLPIPFRTELIPPRSSLGPHDGPLKVLFLGDVREEKGFLLLPELVRTLDEQYLKSDKLRFVIQASIHPDQKSRRFSTQSRSLKIRCRARRADWSRWIPGPNPVLQGACELRHRALPVTAQTSTGLAARVFWPKRSWPVNRLWCRLDHGLLASRLAARARRSPTRRR